MSLKLFVKQKTWFCDGCGAYARKPRFASYEKSLKIWHRLHEERRRLVQRWEKAAKDPEMRCPECRGIALLPKRLGFRCPGCSMRYSPVSDLRVVSVRSVDYSTDKCVKGENE